MDQVKSFSLKLNFICVLFYCRAHWTVECDCEIRYNLCIAFKELHLYEQALKEGLKFSKIVKTLKTVNLAKSQLKSYEATPHAKQVGDVGRWFRLCQHQSFEHAESPAFDVLY